MGDASRDARILMVDDQVANVSLLANVLGRIGFTQLRGITDSRDALQAVRDFQPDLILLDLHMPHLSGFEILKALKDDADEHKYLPVLVLTADASAQARRKALAAGATDLLQKPFDFSEIFMRIRNLLETRSLHREMERKVQERTRELRAALAELKSAQRHVVQQERFRAFGEMAGGVVHDFNNALMSVIGYSELLIHDPALIQDTDAVLDYLRTINTAGRDASHVVGRLRDFYRPREETDVFQPLDLNDIIAEAVALTQPKWKTQAQAAGHTISMDYDLEKLPMIAGNPAELREVLMNLIFNAVDAIQGDGSIHLLTESIDGQVQLSIRDSGSGMSEEVRQRCLDPFFSTKGERGTGLGLSMVFGIIQRHEGSLDIQSAPGEGANFRIRFPIDASMAEPDVAAPGSVGRSLDVLVVDDEPVSRDVVSKHLAADGHRVVAAKSGEEAMEKFSLGHFDLLVTDHAMPGMNGVQLAESVHRIHPGQPVLMISGFTAPGFDPANPPVGIDCLLAKPVQRDKLRLALNRLTSHLAADAEVVHLS